MSQHNGSTPVALERIALPANVRALDESHVDTLAKSIGLRGLIVPLVVRPAAEEGAFTLVAGFHRHAALRKLGKTEADVVIRSGDGEDEVAARAIENIARKQLDPYQEACAVKAMLEGGLSEDGAAQALGWSRRRVTQRARLLALPDVPHAQARAREPVRARTPSGRRLPARGARRPRLAHP